MRRMRRFFQKKSTIRRSVISLVSTNPNLAKTKKKSDVKKIKEDVDEKKKKKKRKNVIYTCVCV